MLRSTGFFRGIDCPFYTDYSDGKGGKNGCNRPYCHFRHSSHRLLSYGAAENQKKELQAPHKEQGYDPFNPEVAQPSEPQNELPAQSGDISGALALVNRAIEEVRSQMEREKRKLSRIGDEPYDPSENTSLENTKSQKVSASHLAYDPCENASLESAKSTKVLASPMTYEPSEKTSLESAKSKKILASHMAYDPSEKTSLESAKSTKVSSSHMSYEPSEKTSLESAKSKKVSASHMAYDPCENASLESAKSTKVSASHMTYEPSEKTSLDKKVLSSHMAYDPSENVSLESTKSKKVSTSHMTYDPGSYQMISVEYNPSPGCSKYTLDSNMQENSANSLEYVPTLMKKSTARSQRLLSSPTSPKYSNSTSSAKCKYTLDNTKPSTDMEYDPLSNYSASIAGKSKKEEVPSGKTNGNKSSRVQSSTEEYVVSVKKPPQTSIDIQKYTILDSDGEFSASEYKPTSISNLQLKKNSSLADVDGRVKEARTECVQNALTQRNKEEVIDLTKLNDVKHKSSPEKRKLDCGKGEKKTVKELSKSNATPSTKGSGTIEKTKVLKTSNHNASKKENKSNGKKEGEKSREKVKLTKEGGKEERQSDLKVKSGDKKTPDSSNKRPRDTESSGSETKKAKVSDNNEKRRHNHKNGQLNSSKSPKDLRIESKTSLSRSSSNSKGSSSKDTFSKSSSSPRSLNKSGRKERSLSLSHADLFGDESPEEAEPMEVDNDDEEDMVVRKCAEAVKRRLNKRKASSSEEESDCAVVSSQAAKDDVEDLGIDLSSLQDDLDFESDPLEECLRIFNESNDVKKEDKGRQAKLALKDSEEETETDGTLTTLFPGQKKRVSHFVAKGSVDAPPKAVVRPYKRPSAQEVCYQRMQLAQQQAAQLSAAVKAAAQIHSPGVSGEKKRIAHRPSPHVTSNKAGGAKAKPDTSRVLSPSQSQPFVRSQTTASILSKTTSTTLQKRVAHMPTLKSTSMKRPVIPTEFGAKVPTNVRQRYLNNFIDECVKFCASEKDAFQMALDEEKVVYERSSSKNIYLNVAVNTLKKLRSKSNPSPSPVSKPQVLLSNKRAQSHEDVLGGRLAATTSFTVNRKGKQSQEKLCGATLYHKLKSYLMSEAELQEHGYPRKDPESSGRALLYNLPEKKPAPVDPFNKVCCRCGAEYTVSVNGNCVRKEECNFHWGRLRRHKVSGGWETSYSCCSGAVGAPGCQVSKQHVQDGRKESLDGFVSTFSKSVPADGNAGVFALDCEMCYTKQGLELTRVTVIDSELKVIYDTFVKPASKVVDYNTRFSGVMEEDLENVSITLRDVQAVLLSLFSAESILLGHSLESDLLALKLIHSTVVDTAIVFPHRLGLPYKRALRNLMADHLKRIIQDSVGGHDSSEDASACMELMMWKIREDAKVKR